MNEMQAIKPDYQVRAVGRTGAFEAVTPSPEVTSGDPAPIVGSVMRG